jgi:hypothetical protein
MGTSSLNITKKQQFIDILVYSQNISIAVVGELMHTFKPGCNGQIVPVYKLGQLCAVIY